MSSREKRRQLIKLRDRLGCLETANKSQFYWVNGIIRERWLHPTRGWRDRRFERFPLALSDGELVGCIPTLDAVNELLSKGRV